MYFMFLMKIKCKVMLYYFTWNILCWGLALNAVNYTLCSKFSVKPLSSDMVDTNPLLGKFFPYVFLFSYILPSGWHFSFLVLQPEENRLCSLQCWDAVFWTQLCVAVSWIWSVSVAAVLKWVRAKDDCMCMCMHGCACVLTWGDVSTWMEGPNSTLIRNKSWKTAGSKTCQL